METPGATIRSKRMGQGTVIGLTILYLVGFPALHNLLGDSATAMSALPVAAMGWYFGLRAGIIASLLAIMVDVILLAGFSGTKISDLPTNGVGPGSLILLLVGAISGQVGDYLKKRIIIERELRVREQFLAKLSDIITETIVATDLSAILEKLTQRLAELFEADDCHITRWNPAFGQSIPTVSSARPPGRYESFRFKPGEANLSEAVLNAGYAIAVEDVQASPYFNQRLQKNFPAQSLLGIPLIAGNHKIGVALIAYKAPHKFSELELRHAEQAGSQIALALLDVQQEAELERRLHESNALTDIGRTLSESERIGLDEVLKKIVDSAKELIPGTEQVVIHLLEDNTLVPRAVAGFDSPQENKMKMRLGEGGAGQAINTGKIVNITDVDTDPRFLRQGTPLRYRSLMVAPVLSGDEKLGTISVQGTRPGTFTEDDESLLRSLSIQAALAIGNAHLLDTTKQGYKEINALYQVASELATSLDTDQLMKDVVELLRENFGYYHVQVYIIDSKNGDLVMRHGSGAIGSQLKERNHRLKKGAGLVGYVVETHSPFFTNNAQDTIFFVPNPLLTETRSELVVPIQVKERVLGALDVQLESPGQLSERDVQLVSAVADQLAIALEKASLYSDLQASLAQEKAMRGQLIQTERLALVGRLLASVSHELNNPLQAIQNALFLLKEDTGLSEQGKQDLQIVLSETERMANLIERLRTSYRPTRIGDFQPTQVNRIVEEVHALMATHLRHKKISVEFNRDPELPPVPGLPDQLRQVVLNLFVNAVDAMPDGGNLLISTKGEGGEVVLSVTDTGPGIDPLILPRIFDAFVTGKESGTGLGLTITYDIVHRHNGRIQAENNPDRGAKFTIWLPAL